MEKRDSYVAGRIDKTLERIGVLFIGHFHDVGEKLPVDIAVRQIDEVDELASGIEK